MNESFPPTTCESCIVVVGSEVIPSLHEYFDNVGYLEPMVAYCKSVGEGRARIRQDKPAVVIVGFPCGADHCPQADVLIQEARNSNKDVRVLLLGEEHTLSHKPDSTLPWPLSFDMFTDQVYAELWAHRVAVSSGFRGHMHNESRREPNG